MAMIYFLYSYNEKNLYFLLKRIMTVIDKLIMFVEGYVKTL